MNKLTVSFDKITIYNNSKNYNEYISSNNIIDVNNISFEIKFDDKFINKFSKRYEITNKTNNLTFEIERALFSDTGFYAIVKTVGDNTDFILEDVNKNIFIATKLLLKVNPESNSYYYLLTSNLPIEKNSYITIQNKVDNSQYINLKIE